MMPEDSRGPQSNGNNDSLERMEVDDDKNKPTASSNKAVSGSESSAVQVPPPVVNSSSASNLATKDKELTGEETREETPSPGKSVPDKARSNTAVEPTKGKTIFTMIEH